MDKRAKTGYAALQALILCLGAGPALAARSASASFQLTKASLDSCGEKQGSAGFSMDSALGEMAVTTQAGSSFLSRSGLIPGYHYPGRITDVRVMRCPGDKATVTWTAPGNDGYAAGTAARAYIVKMSADPAMSPALSDTLFFSAADAPGAAPQPGVSGASDSIRLTGLDPAVTYYVSIMAVEADGSRGPRSIEGRVDISLAGGIYDFTAGTGFKVSILAWNQEAAAGQCTMGTYRLYRSTMITGPFEYVSESTSTHFTDLDVIVGSTYYYRIAAVDASGLELGYSIVDRVWVRTKPSMPPARTALSVSGSSVTVGWGGPVSYDFGPQFTNFAQPKEDELNAYQVWRSTNLYGGWTQLAGLSTRTVSYTDASVEAGQLYYYKLLALNKTETSETSLIRDTLGNGYVLAPDNNGLLFIPEPLVASLSPGETVPEAYWIRSSTGQAAGSARVVLAHSEFVTHDASNKDVAFKFPKPVKVALRYGEGLAAQQQTRRKRVGAEQVAMYWNNGAKWTNIYGVTDALEKTVAVETVHVGQYEARSVERVSGFKFDVSGISNRRITPNGDGLNDRIQFRFDNPADAQVSGRIFDLKGAYVAGMTQTGQFTIEWDGKAGGQPVSGGVYIYQLECEGDVFTGTLAVVR